jgi:hypothetical protein
MRYNVFVAFHFVKVSASTAPVSHSFKSLPRSYLLPATSPNMFESSTSSRLLEDGVIDLPSGQVGQGPNSLPLYIFPNNVPKQ